MPVIELSGVSFSYPTKPASTPALRDVTLKVPDGQFVTVLGRNGSGKSTLAQVLNGMLVPGEGYVAVDSIATTDPEGIWAVRRRLGLVLSNPDSQIVAATVEEDVAFGMENLGVPAAEMRVRIPRALAAVGLPGMEQREPHLLSGGQKQRLAIAGILAMQPRHIVLDEPTSMLDAPGRREVLSVLHRLNIDLGVTVVLITHFVEEAEGTDRVLALRDGRIRLDGRPSDVLSVPEALRAAGILPPYATAVAERLRTAGLAIATDVYTSNGLVDALCRLT